jgi:hypothetical protein
VIDTVLARIIPFAFYGSSLAAGIGAVLILLSQFIEWLQGATVQRHSLLRLALDWDLVPSNWYRAPELADAAFTVLQAIPVSAALLAVSPLLWWCGKRVEPT